MSEDFQSKQHESLIRNTEADHGGPRINLYSLSNEKPLKTLGWEVKLRVNGELISLLTVTKSLQ